MSANNLRGVKDRMRHAIIYEFFGLILAVPLAAWGFGTDLVDTGLLGIFFSILAMIWNMIYNHYFDILLIKNGRNPARRGFKLRTVHAVLFEAGFIVISVPAIAWWLSLSLVQALAMDLGFTLFYVGYTYVYNWIYDRVFPYPGFRASESYKSVSHDNKRASGIFQKGRVSKGRSKGRA